MGGFRKIVTRTTKEQLDRLRKYIQLRICCQIPYRYLAKGRVKFPHPVGIVIGDGVRIGRNVRIYQNVSIGLRQNALAWDVVDQYPIIEDGVTIYAGAVVIGSVTIGKYSIVGANAVITADVPAEATVYGKNKIKGSMERAAKN